MSAGWEAASREDLLALIGLLQRQEQVHKEQIAELLAANAALTEANAALTEAHAVLVRRVAELEKKVNRNSGNSNMPPSTDVFGLPKDDQATTGETGGDGRGAAGKPRRGKRNGAQGTSLALIEDPEVVKDVFPPVCGGCAAALTGLGAADSLGYVRRQCTDIPPVSARVTETRWHTVGCGCGARTAAQVPAGVPDAPCYGPGLAALAVYLLVYQHVPVERTAELIRDLTGAQVSTGWVAAQLPKRPGSSRARSA